MKSIALVMVLAATAGAEPHRLSIEQDPVAYAFHGWDVILAYQHPDLPHARATLSVYGVSWPGRTPPGFDNHSNGVTVKLQYFLRDGGRGWMAGLQIAFEDQVYSYDTEHTTVDALIVGPIAGYRWVPSWGHGFFIYPWGRLGYQQPLDGNRQIMLGDHEMTVRRFAPVLTFHVGYEMTF